jgi:hypothetical protein
MIFFSNNLNSSININMIPLPMRFAQDAQGRIYFFIGIVPQILMIPQPTPVTAIMVTSVLQPLQVVEKDDECYFFFTEKSIHNNVMGTPPQPQKKNRSYRGRVIITLSSYSTPIPTPAQDPRLTKKRALEQY